jgi:hypothetical protein
MRDKTNYRLSHEFEYDGKGLDFRGLKLCVCGFPEDFPCHINPPDDPRDLEKRFNKRFKAEADSRVEKEDVITLALLAFSKNHPNYNAFVKSLNFLTQKETGK